MRLQVQCLAQHKGHHVTRIASKTFFGLLSMIAIGSISGVAEAQAKQTPTVFGYGMGWTYKDDGDHVCNTELKDPLNFFYFEESPDETWQKTETVLYFDDRDTGQMQNFKFPNGSCHDDAHKPADQRTSGYRHHQRIKNDSLCDGCYATNAVQYRTAGPVHYDYYSTSGGCYQDGPREFGTDICFDFNSSNYWAGSAFVINAFYTAEEVLVGNSGLAAQCDGLNTYSDGYAVTVFKPDTTCPDGEHWHEGMCCPEE